MDMRKCKECGKMFMPKGREQYCTDDHYRPCPACGKPVLAKYLSDPARCCSKECQAAIRSAAKMKPKFNAVLETAQAAVVTYTDSQNIKTYSGPSILGFVPGHLYTIEVSKRPNECYHINAFHDNTEDKTVDLYIELSSQASISRYFS